MAVCATHPGDLSNAVTDYSTATDYFVGASFNVTCNARHLSAPSDHTQQIIQCTAGGVWQPTLEPCTEGGLLLNTLKKCS